MRSLLLVLTALLVAAPAASAQEEAAPDAPPNAPVAVEAVHQTDAAPEPVRQAIPRGSRPQGDNPQTGTAVPRGAAPAPPPPPAPPTGGPTIVGRNRGRTIVVRPPAYGYRYPPYSVYSPYRQYYGYGYYPYGYGAFGLGFLYYDPYRWHPGAPAAYGYGHRYSYSLFDLGELRLDVSPRYAQVFVDGYYAGSVDDYDGAFQAIRLAPGAYRIDVTAPGFETLTFDVRITPGQKIRYRGELVRRP